MRTIVRIVRVSSCTPRCVSGFRRKRRDAHRRRARPRHGLSAVGTTAADIGFAVGKCPIYCRAGIDSFAVSSPLRVLATTYTALGASVKRESTTSRRARRHRAERPLPSTEAASSALLCRRTRPATSQAVYATSRRPHRRWHAPTPSSTSHARRCSQCRAFQLRSPTPTARPFQRPLPPARAQANDARASPH
jgi:hypothetical protein